MRYFKTILIFLALPLLAWAAPAPGFLDSLKCVNSTANCQLADVAAGFISLTKLLLGAMGAVALLYFVIGGFQWVTSQGNQEKVRNGQRTMVNTMMALALAFASYLILNFFVDNILGVKDQYTIGDAPGQCEGKSDDTPCNVIAGSSAINPFVCFDQSCVTRCAAKELKNQGNWSCYEIGDASALSPDANQYWEKNICDGGVNNICMLLNAAGTPALFDDPAYQIYENYFRR